MQLSEPLSHESLIYCIYPASATVFAGQTEWIGSGISGDEWRLCSLILIPLSVLVIVLIHYVLIPRLRVNHMFFGFYPARTRRRLSFNDLELSRTDHQRLNFGQSSTIVTNRSLAYRTAQHHTSSTRHTPPAVRGPRSTSDWICPNKKPEIPNTDPPIHPSIQSRRHPSLLQHTYHGPSSHLG